MKNWIKRFSFLIVLLVIGLGIASCDKKPKPDPEPPIVEVTKFKVTFNSDGGTDVSAIEVEEDQRATKPADPTKEGYEFEYWFLVEGEVFDFETPIKQDITLTASWKEVVVGPNDEEKATIDIEEIEAGLFVSDFELNLARRGTEHGTRARWKINSDYISKAGIILPLRPGDTTTVGEVVATYTQGGYVVEKTYEVPLIQSPDVVITEARNIPFKNMTTEYKVENGSLDLYFEEGGSVPYVNVEAFFSLVKGFIDPAIEFTFTKEENTLKIHYQYYDEEEDHTYDLIVTIDSQTNTVSTNDPGFYWAYVYSTETNYGRHITYLRDHPGESSIESQDVVYNLSEYNLDVPEYNGDILLPYYLANQIFVGSSYYNVYYNGDGLYGIYALPDADEDAYIEMKKSSLNRKAIPTDMLIHNFHMMTFDMDYFYGLQDLREVNTYYDILLEKKDILLDSSAVSLDNGISQFLLQTIDEPHTSYGYPSYYNAPSWEGPSASSLSDYGPRFRTWYSKGFSSVNDAIENKWGRHKGMDPRAWAASSKLRPKYWFLDDTHAVVTLDGFSTKDIVETTSHDEALVAKILKVENGAIMPQVSGGTKHIYYNTGSTEKPKLEILVKGLEESYLDEYKQALETSGYTLVKEIISDPAKVKGYYQYTQGDVSYMLQVTYDATYKVLYVGVMKELPESYEEAWPFTVDVEGLLLGDSAIRLEFIMEMMLAEKPGITSVTLDLTWNTGGNVGALYRVIGFVTDQPFRTTKMNGATKGASSSYVQIVGTPTYPHLKWSLLTSPLTFSAGNSLTNIFKENKLGPVIGMTTGGGACSITPILLPNGTAFTMSSNSIEAYRTGAGTEEDPYVYHNVELGINPDYVIEDYFNFFNEEVLLGFLTNP